MTRAGIALLFLTLILIGWSCRTAFDWSGRALLAGDSP